MGYHMTTGHHHWRVLIGRLLFGHWTDKYRVEVVGRWKRSFDLDDG